MTEQPPKAMQDALKRTHRRFTYTPDALDNWRFPTLTGRINDDCDGFAPAVLLEVTGSRRAMCWKLVTFQAVLWQVKTKRGRGHLVLWYRGWWSDNTQKKWYRTADMPHTRVFPWPWPLVAWKYVLGAAVRLALRVKGVNQTHN